MTDSNYIVPPGLYRPATKDGRDVTLYVPPKVRMDPYPAADDTADEPALSPHQQNQLALVREFEQWQRNRYAYAYANWPRVVRAIAAGATPLCTRIVSFDEYVLLRDTGESSYEF